MRRQRQAMNCSRSQVRRTAGQYTGSFATSNYINDLLNCLRAAAPRMFADDTNITLSAKTLTELIKP